MSHYSNRNNFVYSDLAMTKTEILRLDIEDMTGKKKYKLF
jgi:hypothetical protein